MTTATPSTALATIQPAFTDPERLALAGFLAGFRGLTREAYALDLRQFTSWCRARSLAVFAVRRADIESFARELEVRGRARATRTPDNDPQADHRADTEPRRTGPPTAPNTGNQSSGQARSQRPAPPVCRKDHPCIKRSACCQHRALTARQAAERRPPERSCEMLLASLIWLAPRLAPRRQGLEHTS
jgi:hypothetical protein